MLLFLFSLITALPASAEFIPPRACETALRATVRHSEEAFLQLKEEEARLNEAGISDEMVNDLRAKFSRTHDFANATKEDFLRFYKNGLRNRYIHAGHRLKLEYLRAALGIPLAPELRTIAVQLFTSFLTPYSFEDEDLSVARAKEIMAQKPWLRFPWLEAMSVASDWIHSHPGNHSIYEISQWLAKRSLGPQWSWNDSQRLARALSATERPGTCCVSSPACLNCPGNRMFLKSFAEDDS